MVILLLHKTQLFSKDQVAFELMAFLGLLFNRFGFNLCLLLLTDQKLRWLNLVWNHVVAANRGVVLHFLKRVVLLLGAVEGVELLHPGRCVLVRFVFVREEADCTKLTADDEGMTILRELSVQRVVHYVLID